MSAWSLARPSASRVARSSSSLLPHWLQKRARRWFLQPQPGQRSVSLRLGMATNEPLVPSMILRSRMTKASSNVTEQKAWRRSFSLWSSMSLIRTSVITTAVLLFSVAHSRATLNDEHSRSAGLLTGRGLLLRTQRPRQAKSLGVVAAEGEQAGAAATHQLSRRAELGESASPVRDQRAQSLGHG